MYNWLTRTRPGQTTSFIIILILIASYTNVFHSSKEDEKTKKEEKSSAPEPPVPATPGPEPPAIKPVQEPAAPAPIAEPKPMTLEKLIDELTSFSKTQISKAQDQLAELGKPAVKKLIESLYSPNKEARVQAGWALIRIGEPSVQPLLDELAVCEEKDVQHLLKRILKHIGPAIGPLKKIRGNARLQEAAKEILEEIEKDKLEEIEKDKLAHSDDFPEAAGPKEALENYERILAEYRDAAKNLRKAKVNFQTAARIANLNRDENWRMYTLELRANIAKGEEFLADLDQQVKSAKAAIPEPPS